MPRRNILKRSLLGLLAVLIAIQFLHPARNESKTTSAQDINVLYHVPDSVEQVLKKACNDCHSNNTRYPWYNNIQPVAWWLNDHINDGKRELNFSEFGNRALPSQAKKLMKLAQEVQTGAMPLKSYTWIHKDAILTDREKNILIDWGAGLSHEITAKAHNP